MRSACILWLRIALLWIGIYLGLKAKSPEMANGIFGLLWPLTMLSNAFIATSLMPGWLGVIAEWNPISSTINAARELFGNPGVATSTLDRRALGAHGDRLAGGDHGPDDAARRAHVPPLNR